MGLFTSEEPAFGPDDERGFFRDHELYRCIFKKGPKPFVFKVTHPSIPQGFHTTALSKHELLEKLVKDFPDHLIVAWKVRKYNE